MQVSFIFKCCGSKEGELRSFLLYMQSNICMRTTFWMSSSGKMLKILEDGNGFLGSISEKPVGCDSALRVWGKTLIKLKKKRRKMKAVLVAFCNVPDVLQTEEAFGLKDVMENLHGLSWGEIQELRFPRYWRAKDSNECPLTSMERWCS